MMKNTRSGELLSAAVSIAISFSTLTAPHSVLFDTLRGGTYWWAFIATLCGLFCMLSVLLNSVRMQLTARFLSGCVWGSILLVFAVKGNLAPLFWSSAVMFAFDLYALIINKKVLNGLQTTEHDS